MTEWRAPEGMVVCEVGPVVRMVVYGDHYRLVGYTFGFKRLWFTPRWITPVLVPVYRPCDERGEWL